MDAIESVDALRQRLEKADYIADEELATILYLFLTLSRPLLIEGPPGVGKTQIALTLSQMLGTKLIRLQCYEGIDISSSTYEWNYQRQLLRIKLLENENVSAEDKEQTIFDESYLLKRPLLQSILEDERPPVLLIDELDRSDEDFEAFLLELLSDFQITIPEIGTLKAKHKPYVILTSNRTRSLSDALKRRCLYHWIDYPDMDKEMSIIEKKLPSIDQKLMRQVAECVQEIRSRKLSRTPGVSETIDWAQSLHALGLSTIDSEAFYQTMGTLIKSNEDQRHLTEESLEKLA